LVPTQGKLYSSMQTAEELSRIAQPSLEGVSVVCTSFRKVGRPIMLRSEEGQADRILGYYVNRWSRGGKGGGADLEMGQESSQHSQL